MAASTGKSKLSLAKEISRLIKREGGFNDSSSNDEVEKSFTDAKYVNVFRLKTVDGYTHNGEYFFNDGTMTGDDLIGQLTLVIIGYERECQHLWRLLGCWWKQCFTAISRKEKEAILDRLVEKTCNAQQGIIVKARSAESTKKGGSNYTGLAHRAEMVAT
jgi:hypothetical protein